MCNSVVDFVNLTKIDDLEGLAQAIWPANIIPFLTRFLQVHGLALKAVSCCLDQQ